MKNLKNLSLAAVFTMSLFSAGCGEKQNDNSNNRKIPSSSADTTKEDTAAIASNSSKIIRAGTVDLVSIDQNRDSKVFQCPMDYNVVSDKRENCPQCRMDLEEVSLEKARENLKAGNFQVR